MPSLVTHALVGMAVARAGGPRPSTGRLFCVAAAVAVLPDADVLPAMLRVPGWTYGSHRGVTHSLLFAAAAGAAAALLLFRGRGARGGWPWPGTALLLFAAAATHGLLDPFTNGGSGIELFWPFSRARLFWPWTPVAVSPLSLSGFLGERGVRVLLSEALWIWLPAGVVLGVVEAVRRPTPRPPPAPRG